MQMTDQEMKEAMQRADKIVAKVRALAALEDKVLAARTSVRQLATTNSDAASSTRLQEDLAGLESQLKESVAELDSITEELQLATPCFRAYVLPQMSEIMGTLKACNAARVQRTHRTHHRTHRRDHRDNPTIRRGDYNSD